ncbi:hypothetical protein OS493_009654 [Desmophyllum pertusum]|uniref:Uncharacterized protein n=1 Tax=Desmophyllum pertusum TaxID=174260 RepID=A0A9W9YU53_9CNID|nr:hypothetical protein OS493_009654 [Desmophyllum pertusum]
MERAKTITLSSNTSPYRPHKGVIPGATTKNMPQRRPTAGKVGATVTFSQDMIVTMKKDQRLNVNNKQQFINMLSQFLQKTDCLTYKRAG